MNCVNCGVELGGRKECPACGFSVQEELNQGVVTADELADKPMTFHNIWLVLLGLMIIQSAWSLINNFTPLGAIILLFVIATTAFLYLRKKAGYIMNIINCVLNIIAGLGFLMIGMAIQTMDATDEALEAILAELPEAMHSVWINVGLGVLYVGLSIFVIVYYNKRKHMFK